MMTPFSPSRNEQVKLRRLWAATFVALFALRLVAPPSTGPIVFSDLFMLLTWIGATPMAWIAMAVAVVHCRTVSRASWWAHKTTLLGMTAVVVITLLYADWRAGTIVALVAPAWGDQDWESVLLPQMSFALFLAWALGVQLLPSVWKAAVDWSAGDSRGVEVLWRRGRACVVAACVALAVSAYWWVPFQRDFKVAGRPLLSTTHGWLGAEPRHPPDHCVESNNICEKCSETLRVWYWACSDVSLFRKHRAANMAWLLWNGYVPRPLDRQQRD